MGNQFLLVFTTAEMPRLHLTGTFRGGVQNCNPFEKKKTYIVLCPVYKRGVGEGLNYTGVLA